VNTANAQNIASLYASPASCGSCATIHMKFFMNNIYFWPPQNISHNTKGNQIQIQAQWDTIYLGCFDISGYKDTTITICNLSEGLNQINYNSSYWLNVWYIPYSGLVKDSTNSQFNIQPCFNPFESETENVCLDNRTILLEAGHGFASYLWQPGEETSESIVTSTPEKYIVTVTDHFGNIYSDSIVINSICSSCFIPNSFTPNDDWKNDAFRPICHDLLEYELLIFDRWGNRIFSSINSNEAWDGYFGNELAPQDIYVWILTTIDIYGNSSIQRGHLLLIR